MRNLKLLTGLVITAIAFLVTGCTPGTDPTLDLIDTDLKKTKVDDLSRTMGFVFSSRRYAQKEFESKISTGLNRWVNYSPEGVTEIDWQLDPMIAPMIEQFDDLAVLERTNDFSFINTDAYFLQESAWVDEVIERVTDATQLSPFELYRLAADYKPTEEAKDPVVDVVRKLNPKLDESAANSLTHSFKYFDWIVRNIQLLPETEYSAAEIDELRLNDKEGNAAAGVPGTGYRLYPWQTLLYARGDYVDRAKLMMVGLQKIGIDSLMLGVKSEGGEIQPWAVGVAVGDDYYLFDTRLGLPIPGEQLGSFLTLSEARANPKLLESLNLTNEEYLGDDTQYWVKPEQLKDLVGWVYVAPESVAKRMKGLEERLIGEDRLALVTEPTKIVGRLPKAEGLKIEIWDNAFKTHQFRQAVREALEETENNVLMDRLNWYYQDEAYIDGFERYRTSRARFFVGKFESPRDSTGFNAIESFEALMYTDATIDQLATDPNLQISLGILKSAGQDAADFQFQVRSVQAQMRLVRRDTGLFLAQSHFDNGSVSAAANWLKVLKNTDDADRWFDAINYLLGRAYEARKEYDLAIIEYEEGKGENGEGPVSNQIHGNLIRVRMLKELVARLEAEIAANN